MVPNSWISPLGNQTASFVSTLWHSCVKWNFSVGCIVCSVIYSIAWIRKTSPMYTIILQNQLAKSIKFIFCMEQAPFACFPEIGLGIWDWGWFPLLTHFVFPALQHQHNSSFLETVSSPRHKKVGPTYENTNFLWFWKCFKNIISFSSTGNFILNGSLAQF